MEHQHHDFYYYNNKNAHYDNAFFCTCMEYMSGLCHSAAFCSHTHMTSDWFRRILLCTYLFIIFNNTFSLHACIISHAPKITSDWFKILHVQINLYFVRYFHFQQGQNLLKFLMLKASCRNCPMVGM